MDWKEKFKKPVPKFWDMTTPEGCRGFLKDVKWGPGKEPITAVKGDDGITYTLDEMNDPQAVLFANQILDIITNHADKVRRQKRN